MDPREMLISELQAIYTACTPFVKQTRRLGAHLMAAKFTNISIAARSLQNRNDYLLPTYRRKVEKIRKEYDVQVELMLATYPTLQKSVTPSTSTNINGVNEPTISRKISITLPAVEWQLIDNIIDSGMPRSFSEYFRRLHMAKR
ncbi:hypothetical protein [Paenibacillus sp. IITD108]|uniref:hypothetical protein n=1 Tax=Paenibacillus sp. IITD108 TaxID=3116649 RepID=UPI002F3F3009